MNQKILSILLAAALLLGMTTGAVAATCNHTNWDETTMAVCPDCGDHNHDHKGWTELTNDTTSIKSSGKYYLDGDVELSETLVISENGTNETEVTLCLHGQKLTVDAYSHVIQISSGATLNLTDCDTSVVRYGKWNSDQFEISDASDNGGIELKGGVITGGARGVFIANGTLNMYNGNIAGNTVSNDKGGGVCVGNNSMFNMYGGSITENKAKYGGGVYTYDGSTFNMYDGSIANNAASSGGGVYGFSSTFNMYSGSIANNTASSDGGGVLTNHIFNMTGGSITGNSTAHNYRRGGGVQSSGTFKLSGDVTISGNTWKGQASNVYLRAGDTITITGALKTSEQIGVSRCKDDGSGKIVTGIFAKAGSNDVSPKDYKDSFKCDDDKYLVVENGKQLELITPIHVVSITLQSSLVLFEGKTAQLTPTIEPSDATNKNVTWSSSKPSVATVDNHGIVTAVAEGTATITATSVSNPTVSGTCTVTVCSANLSITAGETTQYFESLEEAFDYADDKHLSDFVIKVEKSYAEETDALEVDFSGPFTLDLNGKTISFNDGIEGMGIGYICFAEESVCTPTLQDSVGGGKLNAMLNLEDTDSPIITGGTYRSILTSDHVTISGGIFVGLEDEAVKKLTDSSEYSYKNFAQKCGTLGLAMVSDGDGYNSKEAALSNFSHRLSEGYTTDKPVEIKKIVNDAGNFEYIPGFAAGTTVIKIVPPAQTAQPQTAQPQTGDNSSMALWLALGALSLAGVLFLRKESCGAQ